MKNVIMAFSCGVMCSVIVAAQASMGESGPLGYHSLAEIDFALFQEQESAPVFVLVDAIKQAEAKKQREALKAHALQQQANLKMQQAKKSAQFHGNQKHQGRP